MYMIGYTNPITKKDSEIDITTDYIDFNTYKPECIYYISKKPQDKNKQSISIYCSYAAQGGEYNAEMYINNYECLPDLYEPLTLYDKMLIWMFNNPEREKYDNDIMNEILKNLK